MNSNFLGMDPELAKVAMNKIKKDNIKKGVVLLSPASASWDQYDKFETRGEEFKNIAKSM